MNALREWTELVCRELDLAGAVDREQATTLVLDLARDVAHGVARPAAPLTAYLLGLAAGRAADPVAASRELATRIGELAAGWPGRDDGG